ncbi:MAG: sulfite exporter TauE/SafE family protein [Candidatus Cybelea sp.]|jgi:uncharacterized membrane protein YfcA
MHGSLVLDLLLGLGLGYVSGTFGITGGVIAVPILGFLGFGQHLAQGTSLVMQLPIGVVALWQYARRSRLNRTLIAATAGGSAIATFVGARLAVHLAEEFMRRGFAVFLAALATFTIFSAFSRKATSSKLRWPSASAVGAGGGFCSGLFGVGGATFTIPLFALLFGLSQTEAQGMGLAVVLPAIAIATPTYTLAGFADWRVGLVLGVGAVCSVGFGVALAYKLPQRALRVALCIVLYAGALGLWLRA